MNINDDRLIIKYNMVNIDFLENSWFFQIIKMKKNEILFDEWEVDNNLYIIKKWELVIEKYTTTERNETKILAKLWEWEIFWEWSLSNSWPKQVKVSANINTILLKIEAKNDFENFLLKHTKSWVDLLSSIIYISNKRLLESNFLITSSYKINKNISEITDFNNKNLFDIFDDLSKTINSKYILYFEKHPVLDNYITMKYDTRKQWKLNDKIIQIDNNWLTQKIIEENNIDDSENSYIQKLKNKNQIIWYMLIWYWNENFTEWHKKAISSIAVSIAWFIKQKQYQEDNKKNDFYEI